MFSKYVLCHTILIITILKVNAPNVNIHINYLTPHRQDAHSNSLFCILV